MTVRYGTGKYSTYIYYSIDSASKLYRMIRLICDKSHFHGNKLQRSRNFKFLSMGKYLISLQLVPRSLLRENNFPPSPFQSWHSDSYRLIDWSIFLLNILHLFYLRVHCKSLSPLFLGFTAKLVQAKTEYPDFVFNSLAHLYVINTSSIFPHKYNVFHLQ